MSEGPQAVALTAADVVATMKDESPELRPDDVGDCGHAGRCKPGERPRSLCAMMIGVSNLKGLGLAREELLSSIETCVRAGLRFMHVSAAICRARPLAERQANYLEGNTGCSNENALSRSRERARLAKELLAKHPPP